MRREAAGRGRWGGGNGEGGERGGASTWNSWVEVGLVLF